MQPSVKTLSFIPSLGKPIREMADPGTVQKPHSQVPWAQCLCPEPLTAWSELGCAQKGCQAISDGGDQFIILKGFLGWENNSVAKSSYAKYTTKLNSTRFSLSSLKCDEEHFKITGLSPMMLLRGGVTMAVDYNFLSSLPRAHRLLVPVILSCLCPLQFPAVRVIMARHCHQAVCETPPLPSSPQTRSALHQIAIPDPLQGVSTQSPTFGTFPRGKR